MKPIKYLFLILLGAVLVTGWSGLLPSLSQPSLAQLPPATYQMGPDTAGTKQATSASDRQATFLEADRLYRQGDTAAAEKLYRQVKPEFAAHAQPVAPEPIYEATELGTESLTYWNNAQEAVAEGNTRMAVLSLQLLVDKQPGFIPAHLQLAELLQSSDRSEEAIAVLEQAAILYPDSSEIVMTQARALSEAGKHLEASIAAREFALLYLDHPQAREFSDFAKAELNTFMQSRQQNSIAGGVLNILGGIFSGNRVPWESWDSAAETYEIVQLMLSDESEFGSKVADQYAQQLPLVEEPQVLDYVTQVGMAVAQLMGRDFDYEFYVVRDNSMNAFALPGGKVFVNTGAILAAQSEAELAGVLAHEVAHSVLSHGTQSMFRDNLLAQFSNQVTIADFVTGLLSSHFSRQQEQQSDILGTRVLSTAGYAADGLRNFMATLNQHTRSDEIDYFSTHPAPAARVEYLEELIQRNGYNRFALEGVDKHSEIQALL